MVRLMIVRAVFTDRTLPGLNCGREMTPRIAAELSQVGLIFYSSIVTSATLVLPLQPFYRHGARHPRSSIQELGTLTSTIGVIPFVLPSST